MIPIFYNLKKIKLDKLGIDVLKKENWNFVLLPISEFFNKKLIKNSKKNSQKKSKKKTDNFNNFKDFNNFQYVYLVVDNLSVKDLEYLFSLKPAFLNVSIILDGKVESNKLIEYLNYVNELKKVDSKTEVFYEIHNLSSWNIFSSMERFIYLVIDKFFLNIGNFEDNEIDKFINYFKEVFPTKEVYFLFFDPFQELIRIFPSKCPKHVKDVFRKEVIVYRVSKSYQNVVNFKGDGKEAFVFYPYDNSDITSLGMFYFYFPPSFYDKIFVNIVPKIEKIINFLNKKMIVFYTLQRSIKEIKTLNSISIYWGTVSSVDDILDIVMKKAINLFKADVCSLMFIEDDYLYIKKAYGLPVNALNVRQKIGEGIAGRVAKTGKPLIINDIDLEKDKIDFEKNYKSSLVVPLKTKDKIIGVFSVSKISYYPFSQSDLETLQNLAMICANSIEKVRLYQSLEEYSQKLEETYVSTIKSLAKAFEARDRYNKGHMERVLKYGLAIAFELDPKLIEDDVLKLSLLFHDIGKIEIPDSILNKPFKLTPEEYEVIKRHPEAGEEILKHVKFLNEVAQIVKQHQERWDGKGYPKGLKGEEIHLYARIVALADAFDAMTSDRVYRKAMSIEEAIEEVLRNKGTQFDPMVVDAFMRAYQNGLIKVEENVEEDLDSLIDIKKVRTRDR